MAHNHSQNSPGEANSAPVVTWHVHLLKRHPERLPAFILILLIAALCVWLLFGRALPVLAAVALLTGSAAEYLLPIRYRVDGNGVIARSAVSHLVVGWQQAKRCCADARGLLLTPLPFPSRLDRFRGVFLRYAPHGEPGDRASVHAAIAVHAPELALAIAALDRIPTASPPSSGPHEMGVMR